MSKCILVVDDDADILSAMQIMLEGEGYKVKTAENSEYIYKVLASCTPSLILLDILLSGEDGGEIARKLKKNSATAAIPIILLSAHPRGEQIAKESRADDFIAKPFDIDMLLKKVHTYLS